MGKQKDSAITNDNKHLENDEIAEYTKFGEGVFIFRLKQVRPFLHG